MNDELDLETKDANLAGLLFHQNLPLFLEHAPIEMYEQILEYVRWSDRADFWAFFHQCWNLLPLSYHLKLKYPNHILQAYKVPSHIPKPNELVYTQVLTKQSALFNSWKEMNRVSNEGSVPFRCVSQWATYQTGKLKETLGLPLAVPLVLPIVQQNAVLTPSILSTTSNGPALAVNQVCVPPSGPSEAAHCTPRKKSTSQKKSSVSRASS